MKMLILAKNQSLEDRFRATKNLPLELRCKCYDSQIDAEPSSYAWLSLYKNLF